MSRVRRRRLVLGGFALVAAATIAVAAASGGCYYAHVGFGQARVLVGREPIEDVIARGERSPEDLGKLGLVLEARRFAEGELGFAKTENYTTFFDTGDRPVAWNVTACEPLAFRPYTWTFPFVGEAPYKGFFAVEDAREEAARLEADGYETLVSAVSAYSTLGWFSDPLFSSMLAYDEADLVNTVIHELAHATVFKPGDATFNESVATFLGDEGATRFLARTYGADSPQARRARDVRADEALFTRLIDSLHAELDALYESDLPDAEKRTRREAAMIAAKAEYAALEPRFRAGGFPGFERRPLNNATILGYRRYHTDQAVFRDVLELWGGDLGRAIGVFRAASAEPDALAHLARFVTQERARQAAAKNP